MKKIAGLILAASKQAAFPTKEVGDITALKRIVLTLNKWGVWPILVVTGFYEIEVKAELMDQGVIFIQNEDNDYPSLQSSIQIGVEYLQDKCDAIMISPVNIPLYRSSTVREILGTDGVIVNPSFEGQAGHPVLIEKEMFQEIVDAEEQEEGLRTILRNHTNKRRFVDVDDEGILLTVHEEDDIDKFVEKSNQELFQADLRIMLQKDTVFFDRRMRLLMEQIEVMQSVQGACKSMSLSKSKAWKMINELERQMGYKIVNRRHGGASGGKTMLSEKGKILLTEYKKMEERIFENLRSEFNQFAQSIDDTDQLHTKKPKELAKKKLKGE